MLDRQHARRNPTPVYILASKRNGTLYIGVTGNLYNRISAHKLGEIEGFTRKYNVKMLVWFKYFDNIELAISEEKRLKEWQHKWKLELIEKANPDWRDLFAETFEGLISV
jgi:putative endonuclease